ncbi:MAG: NADH-quinone oxidoreductase subunit I [Lachnoclostridium sp.]|nr:NADH-quinone oxidoreductase subunit I [Lachnoclostridium sp.]
MGSVKDYFSNLGTGIMSLIKGLQVTGKEFVTPKITETYPDNRDNLPVAPRFRAILELIYDKDGNHRCIACGTCERVCPNGTISLDISTRETWDGKKKKHLDKYIYDLGCCTFCNLCVTNCPTDALAFSNDFEQAVFTRDKLVKQLNYLPDKPEPQPTPEEIEKLKAEKEAKIAAAKAAAEAKKKAAAAADQAPAPAAADDAPTLKADDPASKALAAAAGDPEKEARIKAALEKAARLKAERAKAADQNSDDTLKA